MIVDESATIPSDWREDLESLIADPEAEKPSDWDDEMDGEWEAPLISKLTSHLSRAGDYILSLIILKFSTQHT